MIGLRIKSLDIRIKLTFTRVSNFTPSIGVVTVFFLSNPSEIFYSVIQLISINVIYSRLILRIRDECFSN